MGVKIYELEKMIMRHLASNNQIINPFGDNANYEAIGLALQMKVKSDDFETLAYQNAYEAFIDLFSNGEEISLLSLHTYLQSGMALPDIIDLFDHHPNTTNIVGLIGELLKKTWVKNTGAVLFGTHNICASWLPFDPIDGITDTVREISTPPNFIPPKPTSFLGGLMDEWGQRLQESFDGKEDATIKSHFMGIDVYLNGIQPGKFIVVAGLPGGGKTAFATNIALNVGKDYTPILYITNEMDRYEVADRMASTNSEVLFNSIHHKKVEEPQRESLAKTQRQLSLLPISVCDDSHGNWEAAERAIRKYHKESKIKVVFLDYLQQYSLSKRTTSRVAELSEITAKIKTLAMELKITMFVMSQLNREIYGRMKVGNSKPVLADLKESGSIEQDADSVLFLMDAGETSISGKSRKRHNVFIEKNRSGERTEFELTSDLSINKFYN